MPNSPISGQEFSIVDDFISKGVFIMKNKWDFKKILSLFLSVVMLVFAIPLSVFGASEPDDSAETTFIDVNVSDWFYISVEVAAERGFIHGMGNKCFNPQGMLTLAQTIKLSACIHANFYDKEIKPYDNSNHWADSYYDYVVENEIIKETDFSKSDFDKPITRDSLFYIFANTLPDSEYIEINETELAPERVMSDYVEKLFCAGIVIGNENGFELEKNITRAESSIVVSRLTTYSRRQMVLEPMLP